MKPYRAGFGSLVAADSFLFLFLGGRLGPGKDQALAQRSGEQQRRLVPGPRSRLIQEVRIRRRLAVHPEHHDERV